MTIKNDLLDSIIIIEKKDFIRLQFLLTISPLSRKELKNICGIHYLPVISVDIQYAGPNIVLLSTCFVLPSGEFIISKDDYRPPLYNHLTASLRTKCIFEILKNEIDYERS